MLNIFGALGAVGRLLPGYVQGERQAVQDNWNDLNQYNTVQHGQMQNAFDEALFNPRLSQGYDQAANSRMGVYQNAMNSTLARLAFPGAALTSVIDSMMRPQLHAGQLAAQMGQANATNNAWWNPSVQAYYANGGPMMGGAMQGQGQGLSDLLTWFQSQYGYNPAEQQQNGAVNTPTVVNR